MHLNIMYVAKTKWPTRFFWGIQNGLQVLNNTIVVAPNETGRAERAEREPQPHLARIVGGHWAAGWGWGQFHP